MIEQVWKCKTAVAPIELVNTITYRNKPGYPPFLHRIHTERMPQLLLREINHLVLFPVLYSSISGPSTIEFCAALLITVLIIFPPQLMA